MDEFNPDIILLDVVMPYVDGLTILKQLRAKGSCIPTIMLTDKSSVDDKVMGLEFGADDYMTKPFSTKELLARVKSVLRRSEQKQDGDSQGVINVGGVLIKPSEREVMADDGNSFPFTKTEFDLLYYLAERKYVVVSHADLLENVLGYKNYVETKALVLHVANIRKKMAKYELQNIMIKTVAGVGYKLTEA